MRCFVALTCLALSVAGCHPESAQQVVSAESESTGLAALPAVSIGDVQWVTGPDGAVAIQFHVALSAASTRPITVRYATEDGTALADRDYRPASGTIVFPPNSNATQAFNVTIIVQTGVTPPRSFAATLSEAVNATIAQRRATAALKARARSPS